MFGKRPVIWFAWHVPEVTGFKEEQVKGALLPWGHTDTRQQGVSPPSFPSGEGLICHILL